MLSDIESSLRQRDLSKQQLYIQRLSLCQARDRMFQDWRLRYAPMRELLAQANANPMFIKPIQEAFLSSSATDVGALPLKELLAWYESEMKPSSITNTVSWERRRSILHHLRETCGKLSCPSVIRVHACTILLRYVNMLFEDDIMKEIYAPVASAIIVAYKALGQVFISYLRYARR